MLGIYNQNFNNMYINQNYGYGTSTNSAYQQSSAIFNGYSGGFQQQQTGDMNFMMLSMISSLLPMMLGLLGSQQPIQQPQVPTKRPPVATKQPQQKSSSAFLQQLVMTLLKEVLKPGTTGKKPVEVYQEDVTVDSSATGDPHFGINGQQSFDFQGKNNGLYKMLNNSDIALSAKFNGGGEGAATIINSQNLEFKDSNINLVTHADGKFEILQNGEKVGDQTNYNTDKKVIDLLKNNNINLKLEGKVLTTTHGKRTLAQSLNGGNIDNISDTLMKGDTGLLSQTVGAIDADNDGKTKMTVDINKDGKVDEKDTLNYEIKNQFMVHTAAQATSSAKITPEIEAAIKKDIQAGIEKGSAVKGFSTEHGYDARQWNEYLGAKLYTIEKDKHLAAA